MSDFAAVMWVYEPVERAVNVVCRTVDGKLVLTVTDTDNRHLCDLSVDTPIGTLLFTVPWDAPASSAADSRSSPPVPA